MEVTLNEICRGSQKVFARCTIKTSSNAAPTLNVTTDGDISVPSLLLPSIAPNQSNEYIVCLPIINKKSYSLHFAAGSEELTLSLLSSKAKWESRLNYKLHKDAANFIRDYDTKTQLSSVVFFFFQCIEANDFNIFRGHVELPYRENTELALTCYTQDMVEVPLKTTIMGFTIEGGNELYSAQRRVITFSINLPKEPTHYIFKIEDLNNPEVSSFDVFQQGDYENMRNDAHNLMLSAQWDPWYNNWFNERKIKPREMQEQREITFSIAPKYSIVVPLYNTPLNLFSEMAGSVENQTYANWELILVNASPDNAELTDFANAACANNEKIKLVALQENLGISENTNKGIKVATGDFVCFFDHDDMLEPDILFEYTKAINKKPETDLLYCDEDKLMPSGEYASPYFKPDFNLDLLRSNNYICHMLTIRKSLLDQLEPNTSKYDGAQDHNLTLRAIEKTNNVAHVAKVLYHWRITENSTAGNANAKSYTSNAGILAVQEHLDRLGIPAEVTPARLPNTYKVIYNIPQSHPLVSIIIPSMDHVDMLERCITSIINKTTYSNYEILVIENNSTERETFDYYKQLQLKYPNLIRVVTWSGEFNFSKLMNFGRKNAKGEYLLLLNNDTEVITPEWIETMLGLATREDVGVVGVRLYYPDETIQHAGVILVGGCADHTFKDLPRGQFGYFALNDSQQDLSAVTAACLMVSLRDFDSVGGFTEDLSVAFNDVDFCLKLREQGKLNVYTPEVELYHYESVSRGSDNGGEKQIRYEKEVSYMRTRWTKYYVDGDPYYSKNVNHDFPVCRYYHL